MRKLAVLVVTLGLCFGLCGCGDNNHKVLPVTYTYDYAYIELQNGEVVEGEIEQWTDCDGDLLQVTLKNGDTYLVHGCDVTLISKRN